MAKYFLATESNRTLLDLDPKPIGKGGEADVYRVRNLSGCVAKIYRQGGLAAGARRAKLDAMLKHPPRIVAAQVNGTVLPWFAWPTHVVENGQGECAGFLMPEIPLDKAVALSKYMSRNRMRSLLTPEDCSLPRRMQICRNLAAIIAEMHAQGHLLVDLKPLNIFVFRDTGIVTIIDNDGFSIGSGRGRHPATAFTTEYLAPEILQNNSSPASVVNDLQDRFAMAVIIFQILNYGRHPFQGVPKMEADEWNIDLCVRKGYYPFGLTPHLAVDPPPHSIHDCLDLGTRSLFDRAFLGPLQNRPRSVEWRDHFDSILRSEARTFSRCTSKPLDVIHVRIANLPCSECRFVGRITGIQQPPPARSKAPLLSVILALCLLLYLFVHGIPPQIRSLWSEHSEMHDRKPPSACLQQLQQRSRTRAIAKLPNARVT